MLQSKKKYPLWRYCFAAILSLCLIVGGNILSLRLGSDDEIEAQFLKMGFAALEQGNVEAVNIGGSVGKALFFSEMNIRGINLAFDGRDIFENAMLLDLVLKRVQGLKTIFVATGPLGMLMDNADLFYLKRQQYYRVLTPYRGFSPVDDSDWSNLLLAHFFPMARKDRWRGAFENKNVSDENIEWSRRFNSPAPAPMPDAVENEKRLKENNKTLTVLLGQLKENSYFNQGIADRAARTLTEMCRSVTSQGLELVIYSTPVSDLHYDQRVVFLSSAMTYWNNVIQSCSEMGARIFRFDEDKTFHHAYQLFEDPVHLNIQGARTFSNMFAKKLTEQK
jgi:hypothetical protein